jgi:hypothetical protein
MTWLEWLIAPRQWKSFLTTMGVFWASLGFFVLRDGGWYGWVHVANSIFFFSFALREHEKMTK